MMILSMDLGKLNTVCCLYDTKTRKHRFETIGTKRSHVDSILDNPLGTFGEIHLDLIVMEACGPSDWISDAYRTRGIKTIVCSTTDKAWHQESLISLPCDAALKNVAGNLPADDPPGIESTARNDETTPSTGPAQTIAKASTPRIVV